MEQSVYQRFIDLYEKHRVSVYHLALSILKSPEAAEDVLQDVFLTAYTLMEEQKTIRSFRSWLLTATRNRCLNVLRDGCREVPEEVLPPPTDSVQMEDEVIGRLISGYILSCMSEEEHRIFTLHCLDGYTYREIAAGLDMPIGTVQTKCRAARKKMKSVLRDLQGKEVP